MRLLRHLNVVERSQVSEARRIGVQFAMQLGFDEALSGAVAVVVTELANNLVNPRESRRDPFEHTSAAIWSCWPSIVVRA